MLVHESTDGLGQLLKTIEEVRQGVNPRLQYVGFLTNKVNSGSAKQKELLVAVKDFAKDLLLREQIMGRAAVADMLATNRPCLEEPRAVSRTAVPPSIRVIKGEG